MVRTRLSKLVVGGRIYPTRVFKRTILAGTEPDARCQVSVADNVLPGCDAGPGGRVRFVVREIKEMVREVRKTGQSR